MLFYVREKEKRNWWLFLRPLISLSNAAFPAVYCESSQVLSCKELCASHGQVSPSGNLGAIPSFVTFPTLALCLFSCRMRGFNEVFLVVLSGSSLLTRSGATMFWVSFYLSHFLLSPGGHGLERLPGMGCWFCRLPAVALWTNYLCSP